jgi:hypothetical protein
MERERQDPCQMAAAEGHPCFPVSVERKGPEYSVAEEFRKSIRGLSSVRAPFPNPGGALTAQEIDEQHARQEGRSDSPTYPLASFSFDAKCVGKKLLRQARGQGTVFYLYQVRDGLGEFPILREQPYDEAALARMPGYAVILLGRFDGECEAVAAYRKALRESPRHTTPSPPWSGPPSSPSPSPSPTPLP